MTESKHVGLVLTHKDRRLTTLSYTATVENTPQAAAQGGAAHYHFDHDVTVHLNGEDIRALYFPAGHTDGNSIIFFPCATREARIDRIRRLGSGVMY